jgi:hypothetical protein
MNSDAQRGIIETLVFGFSTIHRRTFLLLTPIFIDLFLWLGPKSTIAPLLLNDPAINPIDNNSIAGFFAIFNVWGLLAIEIPTVVGYTTIEIAPVSIGQMNLHSWLVAIPLVITLTVFGILFSCVYRSMIASAIKNEPSSRNMLLARVVLAWLRFSLLAITILCVPLMMISLVELGYAAIASLLTIPVLVAAFYVFFTIDALFVSNVGPKTAFQFAHAVVRKHFRAALGIFLIVTLISLGMALIWAYLAMNSIGTLTAIFGNAYVATGLTASSMVFYQDRISIIQEQEG